MPDAMGRLRIIMLGYMVRGPVGGMTWANLHYLMGLAALGHDVYFFEDSDSYESCYDPSKNAMGTDPTYGLKYAADILQRVGFGDRWAYYDAHTACWHGPCAGKVAELCASTDLLLNRAGINPMRPWFGEIPVRVLIDVDPVFTQVKNLQNPSARNYALQHTALFSLAENIDKGLSSIPDDGLRWHGLRHPIVLDAWPAGPVTEQGNWSTVMQWQSYPARDYAGIRYGMKSESFMAYLDFPKRAGRDFELVLGGAGAPRAELAQNGWLLRSSFEHSGDPWAYRRYIQQSRGEFSVAKAGYAVTRSGWFSERTAAYMASARPVVTQETGFSQWLPVTAGVLSFTNPEQALDAVAEVESRYQYHARAARDIAEEYFDARKVLSCLIEKAMNRRSPA